jgi:Protein of unknown function (DUF3294)
MAAIPPPAVADGNANASLNDAYQGGHGNPHTRVGRSFKRRKTAEILHASNRITEQELGEQEVFHLQQATSALPPGAAIPGAPVWFGPAMAAALAPINVTLNNIDARLVNIEARQANATVLAQADVLLPIRNAVGNVAPNFPATLQDLNLLTDAQRSQLLQFYGRAANPAATRDQRLKQLVGIRPYERTDVI